MTLQNQLKQMDIAVARDIEALRGQIEAMGANLSWYEGDMKAKVKIFFHCIKFQIYLIMKLRKKPTWKRKKSSIKCARINTPSR